MEEVKNCVASDCSGHQPEISLETNYGEEQKCACNDDLNCECPPGSPHYGKQYIVGGSDDEYGRIKGSITLKAGGGGKTSYGQR